VSGRLLGVPTMSKGGSRRTLRTAAGALEPSPDEVRNRTSRGLRHPAWSPIRRNDAACEAPPSEAISHDRLYHSNHIGVFPLADADLFLRREAPGLGVRGRG
jgi:hypothetical protein